MPKGPKGEKRPADAISRAVQIGRIAVGDDDDGPRDDGKDPAAVSMGKRGGQARAKALSKEKRAEIAKAAAKKRWDRS